MRWVRRLVLILILPLASALGVATPAYAATIAVDTTADEFGAGASCSLREAIQSANTDASFGGCAAGSGSDTIQILSGAYTITGAASDDANASGDFDVTSEITISRVGPGTVTISGGGIDRVFHILGGGDLTLQNVNVTGGNEASGFGGGTLVSAGELTMQGGSITNNNSALFGGGVLAFGGTNVSLTRVVVSGNTAGVTGGGVTGVGATITVRDSLIQGNSAPNSAAVTAQSSTVLLENVTVSGNRATNVGAMNAVLGGTLTLVNVTAVDNGAVGGNSAHIQTDPGSTIITRNSLFADPFGGTPNCLSLGGTITSQGSNLSDDASCAGSFNQPGDQNNVEPLIGPLQNNGGPTETSALLPGSPAIDGVVGACPLATDQRGITRPKDGNGDGVARCDIGAFESPAAGRLQLLTPTFTVPEDPIGAAVTVTRTNGSEGAVSTTITLADGTATAPSDYTATSVLVQFADGESGSKSAPFAVISDALDEPDETVNLTLTAPTNYAVIGSPSAALVTITDDDLAPGLSINDVSITEGNAGTANLTFTVTLGVPSGQAVTVQAQTADGTAQAGSDYTAAGPITLTFPPGTTSQTMTVPVHGDTLPESNETFVVNLSSPVNTTISDAQGTGTIVNDETLPSLSISNVTIPEGNAGTNAVTFTVTLSPASGQQVTVQAQTADRTAQSGSDYTALGPLTVTFAPGVTSQTFTVQLLGDEEYEIDETFVVDLFGPSNATIATAQGAVLITNDDIGWPQAKPDDDKDDRKKETEEQRQQRERTNRGNKDDVYTEGNVVEVHQDEQPPYVLLGNRDGLVKVVLLCGDQCPTIRVGDYLEADGEKQHEQLFEATEVTVKRAGR